MKGRGFGESVVWELGMKKSPASFYGGGWFGFEGLCARLLARMGINLRAIFTKSAQSGLGIQLDNFKTNS